MNGILRGERCRCTACGEYFRSVAAFDKHRTGAYGVDRRCLTVDEMLLKGMAKAGDWWVTARMPSRTFGHSQISGDQAEAVPDTGVDEIAAISTDRRTV